MAVRSRRNHGNGLDAWPGYVDALSTLLMVIIFVLLVFVLAQAFLSVALSGSERTLDRLNRQVAELTDMLSVERGKVTDLRQTTTRIAGDLALASDARDTLATTLANTVTADRAALAAKQSEAGGLAEQVRALTALRDQLQQQVRAADARGLSEQEQRQAAQARLAEEQTLGQSGRAQLALLNQQLDQVRGQFADLAKALDVAQSSVRDKDARIANLDQKLNTALAAKVEELQRYRSEFFGKLRDVLANRAGVQVVGDRFVFQSEVLFPVGSAELTAAGQDQITKLAATVRDIGKEIPPDVKWILRVDGHADKQKASAAFSNWELSAQRAITVVKRLIADGVPPGHLAATGFGEYQPLDPADTPDAYARNRRIELRLTDR